MEKIFVIGIGSVLRGDDGIGMKVIDALMDDPLSGKVQFIGGDISGLDLIKYFPEGGKVIIVDAADMKEPAGTIKVFDSSRIKPADFSDKFSTHGMGLLETLTLAGTLDIDCEITIVGVQPENTGYSLELSETLEKKIPEVIETIKELLK